MLNLNDVLISNESLGPMCCIKVTPVYEYKDGKKTDHVVGHKYTNVLVEKEFEKIGIQIPGEQVYVPDGSLTPINYIGLEVKAYELDHGIVFSAKAKGIEPVNRHK